MRPRLWRRGIGHPASIAAATTTASHTDGQVQSRIEDQVATDPTKQGRSGRPWRRAQARVRRTKGDICYLCGHEGAQDVDHVESLASGGAPLDPANHEPIHGGDGCPTCGRKCNQEKGDRPLADVARLRTSRDWYLPA